jgi:protein-S-isoprenylcysteine O-methyltransferase Ste14
VTTDNDPDDKGPGIRFPPPLIFLFAIGPGYYIHSRLPLTIGDASAIMFAGWVVVTMALIVILVTARSFRRANTSIEPWHPASSIITSGIYRFSRNPIYLAYCWATIGIGMILNSWWVVASFIPAAILILLFIIKREEVYLEAKFGEQYLRYKSNVRRWL